MARWQDRVPDLRMVWDFFMSLIYFVSGVVLSIFWSTTNIPDVNRRIAGSVMIFYALFRLRKMYLRTRKTSSTEEEK